MTRPGSSIGADQEGATTVFSLSINGGNGTNSGLTTTDGHKIYLEKEGDLIVGRVDSNNDGVVSTAEIAAFAIAIDPTTGTVSVAQYVSLHNNTAEIGVPDASEVNVLTGKISAVVTVTDGDGDVSTASTDDWRPDPLCRRWSDRAITPATPTVTVDETTGLQSDDTTNAVVISLFAGVVNAGTDLAATDGAAQYATKAGLVSTGSYRLARTRKATTVISISINGGNGIDSGLTTTDGHKIFLEQEGNLIVGRVDSNNDGSVSTAEIAAFAIAIDVGDG